MIRARLSNGNFIMGVDAENVRRLKAGEPIRIDLRVMGGTDVIHIIFGETMADIMADLEQASGEPLPPVQPMPPDAWNKQ